MVLDKEMKAKFSHVEYGHDPEDPRDQMFLFICKFPDVTRADITPLLDDYLRFCKQDQTLEHARFLMLLEYRGETKTATQLWEMMMSMKPSQHGRRVSFLQWATAFFRKDWEELHTYFDEEAWKQMQKLVGDARAKREEAERALEEKRRREEEEAAKSKEELEKMQQLTGVAAKAAFFQRLAQKPKSNQERVQEEAAIRKQIKEAKRLEHQAEEEARKAQDGALCREAAERAALEAKAKAEEEAAKEEARRKREEKERRASFKAAAEARWLKSPEPKSPQGRSPQPKQQSPN